MLSSFDVWVVKGDVGSSMLVVKRVKGSDPDSEVTRDGLSSTIDVSLPSPSRTSSEENSYLKPEN